VYCAACRDEKTTRGEEKFYIQETLIGLRTDGLA
jgi:hypothetical protein